MLRADRFDRRARTPELHHLRGHAPPIFIDGQNMVALIRGQRLGVHQLPEVAQGKIIEAVAFHQGVGELEALIRSTTSAGDKMIRLSPPLAAETVALMNHQMADEYQSITQLYWEVHVAAVDGIVDGVRTTLTELIAEMRAGTPAGQAVPTEGVVDQAVSVAVHGDGNRVIFVQGSDKARVQANQHGGESRERPWWRSVKFLGTLVGLATIAAAVLAYTGLLSGTHDKPLRPTATPTP